MSRAREQTDTPFVFSRRPQQVPDPDRTARAPADFDDPKLEQNRQIVFRYVNAAGEVADRRTERSSSRSPASAVNAATSSA
jgi:phosphoribosylformylglycinamidine (FGAM) synthase-like amidotransferase family enzyme